MPDFRSEPARSILLFLVSGFLASSIQHIHSLRASGVISSQAVSAAGAAVSVLRKSAGNLWTTPPDIFFEVISLTHYKVFFIVWEFYTSLHSLVQK